MTDPFAHDDAAYVLGTLEGTDRAAFEAHLPGCADCLARVDEAALLAALLAEVPADAYDADRARTPPSPRTSKRARHRRYTAVGALAAACLVVLALLVWPSDGGTPPAQRQTMRPVAASSPLRASAALVDMPWGTKIDIDCHYDGTYPADSRYTLLVIDRRDQRHPAGSWHAVPGGATEFTGGTAVPRSAIASVAILADHRPILVLRLP